MRRTRRVGKSRSQYIDNITLYGDDVPKWFRRCYSILFTTTVRAEYLHTTPLLTPCASYTYAVKSLKVHFNPRFPVCACFTAPQVYAAHPAVSRGMMVLKGFVGVRSIEFSCPAFLCVCVCALADEKENIIATKLCVGVVCTVHSWV